jgi:hypothetical protein
MQAPEQVPPVSRLILNAHVSGDERKKLLGGFAVALDRVKGSDRVYARSEFELARMLAGVLRTGDNLGALVPAMRSYIVRQVSGARCAGTKSGAADSVRDFNLLMEQLNASGADYKKISPEEAKPSKDEEAYQDDQFWKSARSKQVLAALQWLNHGNRDLPEDRRYWTLEERSTMEWTVHYLDVLKLIEGWKPEEEPSPEDYYAMKSQVYLQLVQLVPPGKARDNALGNHRSFLEQSWFQIENHNFWFTDVALLLKDTRDREWRLSELSRSANPVIALYAQLEKLIPAK